MELIGDKTREALAAHVDAILAKIPDVTAEQVERLLGALERLSEGLEAIGAFVRPRGRAATRTEIDLNLLRAQLEDADAFKRFAAGVPDADPLDVVAAFLMQRVVPEWLARPRADA